MRNRGLFFLLLLLVLSGVSGADHFSAQAADEGATTRLMEATRPDGSVYTPEDLEILNRLDERRQLLQLRANELERREEELSRRATALELRAGELDAVRTEVLETLQLMRVQQDDRLEGLASMVNEMKPQPAAAMLARVDIGLAVDVLLSIDADRAGKILGAMPVDVSVTLSTRMTELRDPRTVIR